jgi:hypothetical protein
MVLYWDFEAVFEQKSGTKKDAVRAPLERERRTQKKRHYA